MFIKLYKKLSKRIKKSHKNTQTILYIILGSIITLLAISVYEYMIIPVVERLFYSKFPEIVEVSRVVNNRYKDGNIAVNLNWSTSYGDEEKTTSTLTVVYESKKSLSEEDMQNIAKLTCGKLAQINKDYDEVAVVSRRNLLPFNVPLFYANVNESYSEKC